MLKIQQVRQLVVAASSGSFKAAATTTFRSQAAVSIAMRELEKTVGGRLLERDRRGKFTPIAEALLPLFQELLTVHDRVLHHAQQLAQGEQGSISVAVAPFVAEQWLAEVVARFAELHPGVRIRAVEERSSKIHGLVADGTVNIGVAGLLGEDSKLDLRPVAIDSYGVLCSPEHPLAQKVSTTWSALRNERMVGSDAFEVLTAAGLTTRLRMPDLTVTSRAPLLACVRKNLGITILPMLSRPEPGDGFAFLPLRRPTLARTVGIITRSTESLLPAGRRLADMLVDSLREFALRRGAKAVDVKAPLRAA